MGFGTGGVNAKKPRRSKTGRQRKDRQTWTSPVVVPEQVASQHNPHANPSPPRARVGSRKRKAEQKASGTSPGSQPVRKSRNAAYCKKYRLARKYCCRRRAAAFVPRGAAGRRTKTNAHHGSEADDWYPEVRDKRIVRTAVKRLTWREAGAGRSDRLGASAAGKRCQRSQCAAAAEQHASAPKRRAQRRRTAENSQPAWLWCKYPLANGASQPKAHSGSASVDSSMAAARVYIANAFRVFRFVEYIDPVFHI